MSTALSRSALSRSALRRTAPGPGRGPAAEAAGTVAGAEPVALGRASSGLQPVSARRPVIVACGALVGAVLLGVSIGPAHLSLPAVLRVIASHLPFLHVHAGVSQADANILWQIRLPRVVLGGLVGAMLAGGGAAYQGVFRNPLADPYLLGVAAGAGLGATAVIVGGSHVTELLPVAAFAGAVGAVTLTYVVGATVGRQGATASIVLAGVAVAALLTAIQTFLQQQRAQDLQDVYSWILGSLSTATWSDVGIIIPYVAISAVVLVAHRRLLDVLRVGEDEADSLGVRSARVRITVVAAATLGTAAAVAVSGLIGFVGIIVPHTVRLTTNASYRIVVPVSMIGGAAFLIAADVAARTVLSPAEIPIGVVTAFVGAPFFLFVLRSRRVGRTS
jgi:iron complex transport system permease protein